MARTTSRPRPLEGKGRGRGRGRARVDASILARLARTGRGQARTFLVGALRARAVCRVDKLSQPEPQHITANAPGNPVFLAHSKADPPA